MHWLLILIFKSTIKFVGRHKNHAGWYIMWLFPVDYNFTALWWLMVIVERVVMVVKYLWGLFFHMKSLFAHRYVSQRYRRKVNRVRTESWILEKVLTFATSFPDLEKVWSFFGIPPYLPTLLLSKVKSENGYVLLFDRSLNSNLQSKQLGIHIHFWEGSQVSSHFYTSEFSWDMLTAYIKSSLTVVPLLVSKFCFRFQWTGPNVNWKNWLTFYQHWGRNS